MPGIKRSRVVGKDEEDLDELSCSICQDIFEEPVVTQCCRQSFCTICINKWLTENKSCPNDRQPLAVNQLLPAPRIIINMLNKLRIKCENYGNGCQTIARIEEMVNHMKDCNTCDSCKTLKQLLAEKQEEIDSLKQKLENYGKDLKDLDELKMLKINDNNNEVLSEKEKDIDSLKHVLNVKDDRIKDLEHKLKNSETTQFEELSEKREENEILKRKLETIDKELDQLNQKLREIKASNSKTQRSEVDALNYARRTPVPSRDYEHNLSEDEINYLIDLAKKALIKENSFCNIAKLIHQNIKSRDDFKPYNWVIESHFKDDLHMTYTSWHKGLFITFNGVTIRFSAYQINLAEKDEIESARLMFDQFKLIGRVNVDTKLFECFVNECSLALKCQDTFNGLAKQLTDKLNETTKTNWVILVYSSYTSYCLKSYKKILIDVNRLKIRAYEVKN